MNIFHFMINNDISLMEYFKLNPSNFKFYFLTQIHIYLQFSQKAPFVSSYHTNNTQFAIHTNFDLLYYSLSAAYQFLANASAQTYTLGMGVV